ncbi:hypothetical protein B4N89_45670 [Embleya scabrispora]|uniref:Lantibiotic dehydratase n=1 Tax=Embleya scabrispora TaxID=159449 RepID=A0A1T3NJH7_9ACTN|nr:hypothetical protein B4N89_45670 [Embleya scabrispora]
MGWLRQVWAIPEVVEAIAHASPGLDGRVRALCAAADPDVRATRAAVVSVARYLRRMSHRPTPAGLFAGVAALGFGARASARWGRDHRGLARADARWLALIVERLEATPQVVRLIPVLADDTLFVRGSRLIVPYGPGPDPSGPAVELSMRYTAPVRAALELARSPIVHHDLESRLRERFPTVARERVAALVRDLVARRVLLTALRAPSTEPDALGHLVRALEEAGVGPASGVDALREIHTLLAGHDRVVIGRSAGLRAVAAARMRAVQDCGRHPVAVDVRLDADVVLPWAVAREVEEAALLLARLSPMPHGTPAWADYHRRFYRRYGTGALVPLLDVVADSGIGWPGGYPGAPVPERFPRAGHRDAVLSALAQRAALEGCVEVVPDRALLARLAGPDTSRVWLPPHLEVVVRVEAADTNALDRGDFRVVVVSLSRAAGVVGGRFLDLLGHRGGDELAQAWAALPAGDAGTVTAQLSFPPLSPAGAHVARSIRVSPRVVSLGEHRDRRDENVLTARDLVVGADGHRLYVAAPRWGRRVEAWATHALNLRRYTPPLARLVTELPRAACAQIVDFDWGAAASLPFLPRVRVGRVVLSAARWRLEADELPSWSTAWGVWDEHLTGWRARRRLPDRVVLVDGDRRLPLDMDETADRVLLREHLRDRVCAVLEEGPARDGDGWSGGRPHEVVVPVAATGPPGWPCPPPPTRERIVGRDHARTPGASALLYARLHGDPRRQDTILTDHLPALWTGAPADGAGAPVWWFLRCDDGAGDHHLRLRIALPGADAFGATAARVGAWADGLRRAGLLRDVELATCHPETGRWGDGPALAAAQAVFAADSRAVLAHLSRPAPPEGDRRAAVAAHLVAIAAAFTGSPTAGARWVIEHVPRRPPQALPRPLFDRAVRLADPTEDFHAYRTELAPPGTAADPWSERAQAIRAYRGHVGGPHTRGIDPDAVLDALLHAHVLRACGTDRRDKAVCLYLARCAALAHTARTRPTGSRP